MNEWCIYIALLLCIAVHPKCFTIMWGGGVSPQPPPVCSIHLDDAVSSLSCVSCVPASCVHIWFVSCPCFMSLWVKYVPAVFVSLCVNYPLYISPVFWVRFRLVYLLFPGVSFFFFGSQRRRSHFFSLPILSLFSLPACSLVLSRNTWETLAALLLKPQNWKSWIWSTGLSTQLTPSSRREARARGSLNVLTERTPLATWWTRGIDGVLCV